MYRSYNSPNKYNFKILDNVCTLSEKTSNTGSIYTKEINVMKWGESEEKVFDIRTWSESQGKGKRPLKGTTLSFSEMGQLLTGMQKWKETATKTKQSQSKK